MLKASVAMGRFLEAKRQLARLSEEADPEDEKLLTLIDGILCALDQDYDRALHRFTQAGADWHLCQNLEGILGYVLYVHHRYEDARNVYRVAMHSPWKALRDFGVLGVADATLALGQWTEAEPLYESLAATGSDLGRLGLAQFRVRQGKLEEARKLLTEFAATTEQDYWKGVALISLMTLRTDSEQWAASLRLSESAQALVLSREWADLLRQLTVQALQVGIEDSLQTGSHVELLILAEKWRRYHEGLPPSTQLLIGRAYQEAGLYTSALEIFKRLSADPDALFLGGRLAWKCGKYEEAQQYLEGYLKGAGNRYESDARVLLACVYALRNRLDLARESLRGVSKLRDPSLWANLGEVEASIGIGSVAIDHLQKALREAVISEGERRHLLHVLGELHYRKGNFKEAQRCFQLAREAQGTGKGVPVEPIEALCLLRQNELEAARRQLSAAVTGQEADLVKGILLAEDLVRSLQREEDAF
jgi:tetratricopeptide (TPR) repeat protein